MPATDQTTAFVNEHFLTKGPAGISLYETSTEPRVRPGTTGEGTANRAYIYLKAHANVAADGACKVATTGLVTAAGTGLTAVVAVASGSYGWFLSTTGSVPFGAAP